MRELVLKMSVSLDGFVAGPHGEVDWIFRTAGSQSSEWVVGLCRGAGLHLMGSRTFHDMAAFWPYSDSPFAGPMNDIPKVVFSRHGFKDGIEVDRSTRALADARRDRGDRPVVTPTAEVLKSWAQPSVARGALDDEIRRLKAQSGGYLLAHGGVRLAHSLVASGLVDEYRLVIHPVALGRGQPLFSSLSRPLDFNLVSVTAFDSGVVGAVYRTGPSTGVAGGSASISTASSSDPHRAGRLP